MTRSAAAAPELPGYTFVKVLGSGGFSDVYLYDQRLPRRQVAVKVLLGEAETAAARRQFADEANLMAALSTHPSIVTIYHADVAGDGRPYFVMEYCSGPNLSVRYKAARLSVEETLRVGVKIASAVATAHEAGIMHRDIKPANILTNDFGGPALTDFGISAAEPDDVGVTTTVGRLGDDGATGGSTVGLSVPWSPPEMFAENPDPDARADVFSLGATLYTLLAGRTPFERPGSSNTQLDLAARIQRGDLTPLARDDVPQSLLGVIEKAMAPRRENRYARMVDFARALQATEIGLGYAPTGLELPRPRDEVGGRPVDDPDAGETRVSTVRDVVAQPSRPTFSAGVTAASTLAAPSVVDPTTPGSTGERESSLPTPTLTAPTVRLGGAAEPVESTVIRDAPPRAETVAAESSTDGPRADGPKGARPRRRVGLVVGLAGAAAVAIVATVLGIVLGGVPADEPDGRPTSSTPQDVLGDLPPVPTGLVVTADASGIHAEWAADARREGDTFYVALLRGSQVVDDDETSDTSYDFVTTEVGGVCVEVASVRAGARSAEVAQECLP